MKLEIKNGFSLIEVNLAIFVVSIGLLTLFALFPAGLKEGEAGHADTQTALFADYVLATARSEVLAVDAANWDSFVYNSILPSGIIVGNGNPTDDPESIEFPGSSGLYVRYYLDFADVSPNFYGVRLWVQSGQYGTTDLDEFKESAELYYTEIFFSGMP